MQLQVQNQVFQSASLINSGPPAPPAPTDLHLDETTISGSEVLTWSESGNPDTVDIYRQLNGGGFALVHTVAGGTLTWTDAVVLAANDLLEYKIRAVKNLIPSAFSSTVGVLNSRNDDLVPGASIEYPTVEILLGIYSMQGNASVVSISFPKLRFAYQPFGVADFAVTDSTALNSISAPLLEHMGQFHGNTGGNGPTLGELDFPALNRVEGDFFAPAGNLSNISFPALTVVGGGLSFSNNPGDTVTLPNLFSVGANLDLTVLFVATTISLPALSTVVGYLSVTGGDNITSTSAPNLATVGGVLAVGNLSTTSLDFSSLSSVGVDLNMVGSTSLPSADFPVLASIAGNLLLNGANALTTFTAANLANIGGDLEAPAMVSMTSISLPALNSLGGNLDISSSPLMASLSFPALVSIGDTISGNNMASLTSVDFSSLQTVGNVLDFSLTALTSFSAPALASTGADFFIFASSGLITLSIPAMTAIGGLLDASNCTSLASLNVSSLVVFDGQVINFDNDALNQASVNSVLSRGVASGTNTSDYELSNGTNSPPTGGHANPDYLTLTGLGNMVNIN